MLTQFKQDATTILGETVLAPKTTKNDSMEEKLQSIKSALD